MRQTAPAPATPQPDQSNATELPAEESRALIAALLAGKLPSN